MEYIEKVKTGCSKQETGMRGGRRHYEWIADYETVFHDCLVSKEWLKAHYQDEVPLPTIDILVDGKIILRIGSDWDNSYRRGMIRKLLLPLWQKAKRGGVGRVQI